MAECPAVAPIVSVAVLSYNQVDYLRECLESILTQDYRNIQVVVADDASTDGTRELLTSMAASDARVEVVVAATNVGITANSNAALRACRGEFIAWMGGDDVMLPGKLGRQVSYMHEHPTCSICFHDLDVFDSSSGLSLRYFNHGPRSHKPHTGHAAALVKHGTFAGACSAMTRVSASPAAGFDPRVLVASDWLYWIEVALAGEIGFIPEVLGRYRRHGNNVTSRPTDLTDEFVTLALLEGRYVELARAVRRGRARLLFLKAVQACRAGKYADASRYTFASLIAGGPPMQVFATALNGRPRRF